MIGGGRDRDYSAENAQIAVNRVLPEWKQNDWFVNQKSIERSFWSTYGFVPTDPYYALLVSFDKDTNYISYTKDRISQKLISAGTLYGVPALILLSLFKTDVETFSYTDSNGIVKLGIRIVLKRNCFCHGRNVQYIIQCIS